MSAKKLVLCVCGAGINTSINAEMTIKEYLDKLKVKDYDVKHCMVSDLGPYKDRKNMVVCWMTSIDEAFNAPSVQGLSYLIGTKKQKEETTKKIIDLMESCYEP
jgi:galactitol-specific phosphotransferase system IIB component